MKSTSCNLPSFHTFTVCGSRKSRKIKIMFCSSREPSVSPKPTDQVTIAYIFRFKGSNTPLGLCRHMYSNAYTHTQAYT